MTPLQIGIVLGEEDECLFDLIDTINEFQHKTVNDIITLRMLWSRLNVITAP